MKNNNQAVIRKMAGKSLAANRGRNTFLVLAVFLTTFMLATIISISISYMESLEAYRIRLEGTTAHIGLMNIDDGQIEKIKELDYVSSYATGYVVANVEDEDNLYSTAPMLAWCDATDWEIFRKPAFTNIIGEYPRNCDEIMVPFWVLDDMGITEPELGMDIEVTFQIGLNPPQTQVFKLSGYFTSYVRLRAGGNEGMLVSREFAELSGHTVREHGNVQIRYVNDKKVLEYNRRLAKDLSIDIQDIYTVAKYNALSEDSADPIHIIFAVLAIILVLVGYLLIYNVLSVSVSRDVRFYGLLKTIGTTPRQIRKNIYIQMLYICCTAVPAGLLASMLVSLVFIPGLLTDLSGDIVQTGAVISFNPVIYISAVVFAVLTAITGALIPAKKAARISPIESVRFTEQGDTNCKEVRSSAFNALKVAWRNVFRVRKRAVLVFISLFLGMTMFMAVTTILESASIDKMVEASMGDTEGDICLRNRKPSFARNKALENDDLQIFTPELIRYLKALPGLTEMKMNYRYPLKMDGGITDMQGNIHYMQGEAFGVEKGEISGLTEDLSLSLDTAAFERGEFILLKNVFPLERETVEIFFTNAEKPVSLKIGGYLNNVMQGGVSASPEIYLSDSLLQELVREPIIYEIALYIEESAQRQALGIVKTLTGAQPDIKRKSALEVREEFEKIKATLLTMGGGISVILWMIGVLNFINIITTSILSRRHELALLESIGQSPKQSRKMLMLEGGIYAVVTLLLVCIAGGALTYGLFSLLAGQYDSVVFSFPYLPLFIMVCVVLFICLSIPRLTYRFVRKMTLVERLREAE